MFRSIYHYKTRILSKCPERDLLRVFFCSKQCKDYFFCTILLLSIGGV